ncbi:uncharacterized protein YukE [Bacillus ectoiniformans]|uniref:YwqH-like family protein n=1 Tax=Bacillus ectoiniformans TaxID=1494429 RepID=UPI00195D68C5|nr:DUF5082 family protein [Bacillus ectoiniformans]MBM7647492.1 uncharacterized protein YukE [Bacillus ectoiniformans]
MSHSSTLSHIQAAISSRASDLSEKIERLNQAKKDIQSEQDECLGEIKKILNPDLGNQWVGKRAAEFQEFRQAAYTEMESIIKDKYDDYMSSISLKILQLQAELAAAQAASFAAQEIGSLINKGEDFIDQVSDGIASLKGWIS